jgi:hypothetical protein
VIINGTPIALANSSASREVTGHSHFDYNIYWNNGGTVSFPSNWKSSGFDTNSIIADPMFRNPAANDYTVTNPAVLQQSGFVNFPMDQFGKPGCPTPLPIHNSGSTTPISDPEPFMGATITSVDTAGQSVAGLPDLNGVFFLAVPLNSYAYKQGFRINDVIRSVNGTNITMKASFWAIYNTLAPGSAVHTIIYRNQTNQEFNFKKISGAETSN